MIPKIIHYIWFGRNPYPPKIQYCIESWKKKLPDYEFMLWNEDTFDVNSISFTRQAAEYKKWAFVSDYVRIYALYNYGGWYLDTDVEIVRSLNPLLDNYVVLGTDENGELTALMGSEKKHIIWKRILDYYKNIEFVSSDCKFNMVVNNIYIQNVLKDYGFKSENKYQELSNGIIVYPDDYFHVISLMKGIEHRTNNTYAIHWHTLTWVGNKTHVMRFIRLNILKPLFGVNFALKIVYFLNTVKNVIKHK